MRKIDFIVLPYRDSYFRERYGSAVRDLQIVDALASDERVSTIFLVNRPVSVYERVLGKRFTGSYAGFPNVKIVDSTSFDLIGPLRKRKWLSSCYKKIRGLPPKQEENITVVLDFLPIGEIDYKSLDADFVWYDLIDNFRLHNRYDDTERELVGRKYLYVQQHADLVTGVSEKAVAEFPNSMVVSNGAGLNKKGHEITEPKEAIYDFGFIGFITDKLDIELIRNIAGSGHPVLIAGEFYDRNVKRCLDDIDNVTLHGKFEHRDIPAIVSQFKVGLIPYIKQKLHDESPLKLYQYLKYGRPVLTSVDYELSSDSIVCYDGMDFSEQIKTFEALLDRASKPHSADLARSVLAEEHYWDYKIDRIIKKVEERLEME